MADKVAKAKRAPKTIKEIKFVKEYMKSGNATKAALAAYDTDNEVTAASIGYQNLKKLQMGVYFHQAGLTLPVIAQNTAVAALTSTKQNNFTGEIDPDWDIRLKAMKFATDLMGLTKEQGTTINIVTPIIAKLAD